MNPVVATTFNPNKTFGGDRTKIAYLAKLE